MFESYEHADISSLVIAATKIAIDLTCTGRTAVYKHAVRKVTVVNILGRQFMYRRCKHIHKKLKKMNRTRNVHYQKTKW